MLLEVVQGSTQHTFEYDENGIAYAKSISKIDFSFADTVLLSLRREVFALMLLANSIVQYSGQVSATVPSRLPSSRALGALSNLGPRAKHPEVLETYGGPAGHPHGGAWRSSG